MAAFARFACALLIVVATWGAAAAEPDPYAPERAALIKLFREIEAGINAQDIDRMVAQMHPAATVTWLNGEVSRGHDEILAYYLRMVKGDQRYLNKYVTKAEVSKPARFLGNGTVAIADGIAEDDFFPVSRAPFHLSSRWSATCAKVDGEWKMMTLHLSSNVFTNELITEAKRAAIFGTVGGAVGGLLLGWLIGRRRKP
jgi:hypothetical protein